MRKAWLALLRWVCRQSSSALLRRLRKWDIDFVIRASVNTWVKTSRGSGLLGEVCPQLKRPVCYSNILYQKERQVPVNLAVCHREPADEPWYLATNMDLKPTDFERIYRQRMWIEESFRDAKSNFGLDELWLSEVERMERMMIVVALAMLLSVLRGLRYRQKHGTKDPQLSTKKQGGTVSLFRIGLEVLRLRGIPPAWTR